ncbi:hypothetical protein FC093_23155 [Ilyomonas limi]|uniref:Uncharacterized protein n=1 Tax=Ilyomonas limi TaxID=2575867 RepID=A0A4U3KT47_9BACT|nr:hypothetical protein [Ilyomonas limi]TKK64167.1 hypothetical protein FC093_23155 [Ilyomonas limi]
MMSHEPQRQVLKSTLTNPNPGITSSISKPLLGIGYRLVRPPETPFNKGNVLFAITMTCQITFAPDTTYSFEMRSVTEIIDNKKPLAVWALKMVSDKELIQFDKAVNEDIKTKGVVFIDPIENIFADKDIENEIKIELDEFLKQ